MLTLGRAPTDAVLGEMVLAAIPKVVFEFTVCDCTTRQTGSLCLTTLRVVLKGTEWTLDLPLSTTNNEKFEQPLFQSNRLSADTSLAFEDDAFTRIRWTIFFVDGGAATFIGPFYAKLQQFRLTAAPPQSKPVATSRAFYDPEDPTKLYIPAP